jgi:t-SNARE complex subunit (syntaxin)
MKKQKIHKMESSILELTEIFKDIEKLQRKWIDQL